MKKKAQFFLIAGLIIATIILGLGQVFTNAKTQQQEGVVYQLSDEIYYETSQVIDNGIFNEKSQEEIVSNIQSLTSHYASYNPDSDIVMVYGNVNNDNTINLQEVAFNGESGDISVRNIPTEDIEFEDEEITLTVSLPNKEVREKRKFKINEGQNFYVVLRKKISNEQYIIAQ